MDQFKDYYEKRVGRNDMANENQTFLKTLEQNQIHLSTNHNKMSVNYQGVPVIKQAIYSPLMGYKKSPKNFFVGYNAVKKHTKNVKSLPQNFGPPNPTV